MKFGLRRPSLCKRIAARTSVKRYIRHSLKVKAPRGWVTNPKRAVYNRIYNRTTVGVEDLLKGGSRRKATSGSPIATLAIIFLLFALFLLLR
ncbi:MAG TPA: hypothetical protein VGX03_11855 [Candidatus Binatia bacterium]|jgi:hypothetical protein|nr:hypothetical protein [Candidatus Binatia bacterium]